MVTIKLMDTDMTLDHIEEGINITETFFNKELNTTIEVWPFYCFEEVLQDGTNGHYDPMLNIVTLMENSRLITVIHELVHSVQNENGALIGNTSNHNSPEYWTNVFEEEARLISEKLT